MKKVATIGLLTLLLCHILAHVLVAWMVGWQQQSDLTNRLSVYRSVDSLVEFYIPIGQQATAHSLPDHVTEGFVYRDSYYDIVRQEIKNDTLLILGYANKRNSFWQQDLLDFINHQIGSESGATPVKAHHLLKNLIHDYDQGVRFVVSFRQLYWPDSVSMPIVDIPLLSLVIPIPSPPPEF